MQLGDYDFTYKLTWEYTFQYQNDLVQFAYCIPYKYSTLMKFIFQIKKQNYHHNIIRQQNLCNTLGGLKLPILTITDFNYMQPIKLRKCCLFSCRVHPGQSNSSYMMQGFLQFIISKNQQASQLRKKVVFKIIPMLNPDGVILGNYRTGLTGKDFNRTYHYPNKLLLPQVYAMKQLALKLKLIYKNNLFIYIDFHGHSIKKNVFMYGPQYNITEKGYYESKIFPKMLSIKTEMFRFYSCIFRISISKQTTARAVFQRSLRIPYCFTIQASNGSFFSSQNLKDIFFNKRTWYEMGMNVGKCLLDYVVILLKKDEIIKEKIQIKKKKINNSTILNLKKRTKKHSKQKIFRNNLQQIFYKQLQTDLINITTIINVLYHHQDIKKDEAQIRSKLSDDEISEGQSDSQNNRADLSPGFQQQLISIMIKNNKYLGKAIKTQMKKQHKIIENIQQKNKLINEQNNKKKIISFIRQKSSQFNKFNKFNKFSQNFANIEVFQNNRFKNRSFNKSKRDKVISCLSDKKTNSKEKFIKTDITNLFFEKLKKPTSQITENKRILNLNDFFGLSQRYIRNQRFQSSNKTSNNFYFNK